MRSVLSTERSSRLVHDLWCITTVIQYATSGGSVKGRTGVASAVHRPAPMNEFFHRAARAASAMFGSAWAFIVAVVVVLAWAATGPLFHYSDTWQLVIN